ncbi:MULTISPECIES: chorismate mutase [Rhodococcus]|uniref:chorismate mutase n=1 Tax=Rhodococcus oxybenzonivorans TaxID=1990687 RepID=A0AAE4V5B0_9NOCA|nr:MULTISPECIES: chorismate mutase [Rhodococcus]MDV7246071.1 chorismate mutase [Rhodococcus oxybenzonivorans]MDV7268690.1 chorismate mutase [Rhodococcus oxybenzonivorans]MDV7277666.1 chorismate mutase [Rhodococcus oxybenzonivorans]MDV7337084.1 chorismate mutase [Rhodococcus oxybenzonivorans]MDV7347322.1 chorismate mutase [Rhodococcus oxybenzonivorans]
MPFRVLRRAAVVLAFCGVVAGIGGPAASAEQEGRPLQPIVEAVALRLTTADTVAASKWRSNAPIDDPAREEQVLASVTAQALDEGLDAARVHQIFRDQIEANKDVQRALFAWWSVSPGSAPAIGPDLSQVRPVIDRQNTRILDQMQEQKAVLAGTGCLPALLDAAGAVGQTLGPLHQATLARALVSLCGPVAP